MTSPAGEDPQGDASLEALIAEELSRARQRAGLSQREMARQAGLTQAAISRLESGARLPRLETLLSLAAASGHVLEIRLKRPRGDRAGKSALRRG